jgi:hypothetical protein
MHRHDMSYRHPISTANGVKVGMCNCGIKLIMQDTESRKGQPIPRDVDTAHSEASAEYEALAMTRRETCTGTVGSTALPGHYGRLICDTCGNSVFPNKDGKLRRHVAKKFGE